MAGAAVKSTARGSVAGVTIPTLGSFNSSPPTFSRRNHREQCSRARILVIRMRRMAVLFLHCLEMAKADEFFVLLVP